MIGLRDVRVAATNANVFSLKLKSCEGAEVQVLIDPQPQNTTEMMNEYPCVLMTALIEDGRSVVVVVVVVGSVGDQLL